ncbi:MAG: DUF4468 domain-containing protein, partial [Deltaproteobacteria bacterium]|nr:DUF4468 domain-containing protein [Deltaproteobacteria bacterium]
MRTGREVCMTRIRVLLLLLVGIAGCAAPQVMQTWDFPIRNSIEIEGLGRERLFDLTRLWFERYLYSSESIIEYANREEGVIVANGDIDYPASGREEIERIQYTISFRVRAEVSAGLLELVFADLLVNVPKSYSRRAEYWLGGREYFGGYSRPPLSREEYDAARRGVARVV